MGALALRSKSPEVDPPSAAVDPSSAEVARRVEAVKAGMGEWGDLLRQARFSEIDAQEMRSVFASYDRLFFAGGLGEALRQTSAELDFRFSTRMTRAAGRTRFHYGARPVRFDITLSAHLLANSFADVERSIVVNGVACDDRVDAFLRVFEHELIHLLEYLEWGSSSCRRRRFQQLARSHFGHTEFGHRLVTQRERAQQIYGLGMGDRVVFEAEGARYVGIINRITRRATVLVKDRRGRRYSDGRRYRKFYVPLPELRRLG